MSDSPGSDKAHPLAASASQPTTPEHGTLSAIQMAQDELPPSVGAESSGVASGVPLKPTGAPGPAQDPMAHARTIYLGRAAASLPMPPAPFCDNNVSTAKYNFLTFLPKFFKEQFSKYANIFFLMTSIIQLLPDVSPTSKFTTIVPLSIVLFTSACKEIYEDVRRHKQDKAVNRSLVQVLVGGSFVHRRWAEVRVGDIVRVEGGEPFPADLILLSSSEPDGLAYVETANLDGETNLKIRQARPETAHLITPEQVAQLSGIITAEAPNNHLYTFEGTLAMSEGNAIVDHSAAGSPAPATIPLDPDQVLLRGSTLRNSRWVYAAVIYTGHETKLMMNASAAPIKRTSLERMTNVQIAILFIILVTLATISAVGSAVAVSKYQNVYTYLGMSSNGSPTSFILNFLTFIILYNNLIPISLIVTMEIVKFQQASLINEDLDMYYNVTDTPAAARTSNLVEELGRVEYIFSDKTGTLTCNKMELKQCIVAGSLYVDVVSKVALRPVRSSGFEDDEGAPERPPPSSFAELASIAATPGASGHNEAVLFLTLLAVCHTVIPEAKDEAMGVGDTDTIMGDIVYQASSPDEGALVKGAAELGFKFHTRRPRSATVRVGARDLEFEILHVLEFNSTRKRMSVVVRMPDKRILLMTKGADTVILERLRTENPHVDPTMAILEDCANEGLRTLCLAVREVPEEEYRPWAAAYERAALTVRGRAEELDRVADLLERDLFFLGATAIEDRLQDGVPETIHVLAQAGIKIWVLTGDRQETAINIGYSCKLLTEDMSLIIVNEPTKADTRSFLEARLKALSAPGAPAPADAEPLALIIDGKSLAYALEPDLEPLLYALAAQCRAVLACRVSPLQKALIVGLVKRHAGAIVLAIGDGANDVSMIQAAHIGVGISGQEGLQAARSADYAISQFRYLRKLLLVHGSWSYQRLSKLILYSFYKNITLYMTQFWFSWFNLFSGQTLYESWLISLYNVIFTFWPPVMIGVTDQHITARQLDAYPQLYELGQRGEFFNVKCFWGWTANAFVHSLILFFMAMAINGTDIVLADGRVGGHWFTGTMLYTAVLMTVLLKAALITTNWTKFAFASIPGSMLLWFLFLPLYDAVMPSVGVAREISGVTRPLYSSAVFWLTIVILPIFCLYRDYIWKYVRRQYRPKSYHIIQEFHKFNIPDYRPRMDRFRRAIHKVRMIQRMKRSRGYAFSQSESGQANLIRRYDTTKSKPAGI